MKAKELIGQLLGHDIDYEVVFVNIDNQPEDINTIEVNDTQKEIYLSESRNENNQKNTPS